MKGDYLKAPNHYFIYSNMESQNLKMTISSIKNNYVTSNIRVSDIYIYIYQYVKSPIRLQFVLQWWCICSQVHNCESFMFFVDISFGSL